MENGTFHMEVPKKGPGSKNRCRCTSSYQGRNSRMYEECQRLLSRKDWRAHASPSSPEFWFLPARPAVSARRMDSTDVCQAEGKDMST